MQKRKLGLLEDDNASKLSAKEEENVTAGFAKTRGMFCWKFCCSRT